MTNYTKLNLKYSLLALAIFPAGLLAYLVLNYFFDIDEHEVVFIASFLIFGIAALIYLFLILRSSLNALAEELKFANLDAIPSEESAKILIQLESIRTKRSKLERAHLPKAKYTVAVIGEKLIGWLQYHIEGDWLIIDELHFKGISAFLINIACLGIQIAVFSDESTHNVRNIKAYEKRNIWIKSYFKEELGLKAAEKNADGTWYHYGEEKAAQLREAAKEVPPCV